MHASKIDGSKPALIYGLARRKEFTQRLADFMWPGTQVSFLDTTLDLRKLLEGNHQAAALVPVASEAGFDPSVMDLLMAPGPGNELRICHLLTREHMADSKWPKDYSERYALVSQSLGAGGLHAHANFAIVVELVDKAGSLCSCLRIFSKATINLTAIESRPVRGNPGRYRFFLQFRDSKGDPELRKQQWSDVLDLEGTARHLGSFKETIMQENSANIIIQ